MQHKLSQSTVAIRSAPVMAMLLLGLLTGCMQVTDTRMPPDDVGDVQAMAKRGDHPAAMRAYLGLAQQASGDQRQRYLLLAAGESFQANDVEGADEILAELGEIAAPNLELWAEVAAEVRLAQNDAAGALQALNQVASTENRSVANRILLLRSEALFRLGRPQAAVTSLLQREQLLTDRNAIEANRRLIWTGLQGAGSSLPRQVPADADRVLAGWLQLGQLAYAERNSMSRLYQRLDEWRRANPTHPAAGRLLDDVMSNLSQLTTYPNRIALLLPVSGRQQAFGEALRDGYLAAHFKAGNQSGGPDIRVYDTGRLGAAAAYQQAIAEGAAFVVGPLLREEVSEVLPVMQPVSTLLLNRLPDDAVRPANLYQFALAPEDEARAAAQRAIADGYRNAMILAPATDWGRRVRAAFEQELMRQRGAVVVSRTYSEESTDFSALLKNALLLDESYARRDRLVANLGTQVEFEPRRRQDVDFIFLAANSGFAKLMRPQLRFHFAGDIPVYATSAVYQPGSADSTDLNEILFPDIPWLLNPSPDMQDTQDLLSRHWGPGTVRLARFYAMGYDAYRLTAVLHGGGDLSRLGAEGATGRLQLDRAGVIQRELSWGRFERGRPRALPSAPRGFSRDIDIVLDTSR